MRLKPRVWFVISLLLFAASIWTWHYAEKYAARHRAATARADASTLQHPPLVKAVATNAAAGRKSYRISNTSQTIGQLLHNNHAIILRNALIDTEAPVGLKIPSHLRANGAPGSYLVQADRPLDKDFYAEVSKAGASYISYVPNNAALVQASPEQATNLAANADVVVVLPYQPYYKLDGTLLPSAVEQQPQTNALSVTTFPGQRDAALAALTQLGATLIGEDRSPFGPTLIVSVPPGSLVAVAQLPLAQEIEAYTPRRLMNDLTRVQLNVSSNTLLGTPDYLNLSGLNVTVNINDTGVDSTHPDFLPASRLVGDFPGSLTDYDGHGTHVAGIIAGNGSESKTVTNFVPGSLTTNAAVHADFRGKATNATLFVQALDLNYGPYVSDAFLQENASSNMGPTNWISNNSWTYSSTVYDMHAASYDAATRDAQPNVDGEQPMLFIFAAGNGGNGSDNGIDGFPDTINSPGTAKNVITVGASDSPRFITNLVSYDGVTSNEVFYGETDNSNLVAAFSSCGNVGVGVEGTYGRFKPDVVAPGVFTISCRTTNYVDPTNELYVTDFSYTNTVALQKTNYYVLYLPDDTAGVTVIISSNATSPSPFPKMLLYADTFEPPTDLVSSNNFFALTNYQPGEVWFFGVVSPSNQPGPVEYAMDLYLFETNYEGDYFTVLSNMNNVLLPYYRYDSGTSMSAGAVSGMLALMQEFLQSPSMNMTNPSPALLKAMLINGSRSLGLQYDLNVNTEVANEQGWGLPNITNTLPSSLTNTHPSMVLIDQSPATALATGQYQTYTITCSDSNAAVLYPLRITLVWTDPPGNPAAGVALVNNLDLTVADASNNIYIGNNFPGGSIFTEASSPTNLPSGQSDNAVQNIYVTNNGTATFTSAGDSINNVQNVYINPANVPITFPLTITISGTRVNVNAVTTQTNNIAQDYALVISSDDPALSNSLTIATSAILATNAPLITVASNGIPLLHQRVGANEPNLYMSNGIVSLTNGSLSQWHFFIFTNAQLVASNTTNVAFATFLPPELSIPRASDSADIDLYVYAPLTPLADFGNFLLNNFAGFAQSAVTSVGRTGTESVIFTNSFVPVYYIGVKSEDQQAADFGFYAIAQQAPFSAVGSDGSITAVGSPLPAPIPNALADGVNAQPAMVFAFLVNPNPLLQTIRRVTTTVGIAHGNPSDLYGAFQHNGVTMVLNHYTGPPGGFTNTYDDLQENPGSGDVTSDGPGSLTEYVGQPMNGLWLLTETDNAITQTGDVTLYSVTVDPHQPTSGFLVTIGAGQWFDDYVNVPNDATNMIISAVYENSAGSGPIGIYLNTSDYLTTGDYGSNNINPPGGSLTLGTNNPPPGWPPGTPPLSGGVWYYGIYNQGSSPVTLFVVIQIEESLTPNLVQSYTNNTPISLTTDGHTQSQICITNGQQVVALQIGVRIDDTNLDDLVLHLTSPQGTSVDLFENRGGLAASNLGLTEITATVTNTLGLTNYITNYVYTVFTENTNLTTTPIKFAPPPFAEEVDIPISILWSNSFETVTNGVYTNGAILEGWLVTNNLVTIATTNGPVFLTNDEVGIVTDPNGDQFVTSNLVSSNVVFVTNSLGTNYLALTSGRIIKTFGATNPPFTTNGGFAIANGQPYQLQFYVKPLGITDWWPADNNTYDIIGTNIGTIPYSDVTYDAGEVDRAFTFSGISPNGDDTGNKVDFGTNVGNFGTNDFTIEFWIKQPTNTGCYAVLEKRPLCNAELSELSIRTGNPRPNDGFNPYPLPGQLDFEMSSDGVQNTWYFAANKQIDDGIFHHAAFTRQGTSLSIYVDGILDSNSISLNGVANILNFSQFRLGQNVCVGTDSTQPFIGDLDEVSLYNRALSPAEIYAIYYAGSLGKYSTNSILPNFTLTIDGVATNTIILTNASGGWQLITNSFVANGDQLTIEFAGNALGVLLDDIQLIQLPATNYNNYYLPEEPLTPFVGENPLGCWTLDVWDTRQDSSSTNNGTLLSWTMQVTTSSTNATLYVLTNFVPMTITNASSNGMTYFAVDVPAYASYATNILTATLGGPLTLYFDQTALPTGGLPGDVLLASGVQNGASTNVLSTLGAFPPLLPGQRYFLGVLNNGAATATFTIEVDFNGMTNGITPLTNEVAVVTNITSTSGPQYYSFVVPTNATMVTFQILNPTNGEVDLYAREGLPLPGPSSFDYESDNAGTNDQFIAVTTNSVPVPLLEASTNSVLPLNSNTWYLAAYNVAAVSNISYTIIATVVTSDQIQYIQLLDGVPNTNGIASPGYPTNLFYYYTITNSPAGVQFTVTNLTGAGNVELLADLDVLPTPNEFYSGSFNSGTTAQLVQIVTNSAITNLNGTWYLAVPNTSVSNVAYSIEATTNITTTPLTNAPLVLRARIASLAGGSGFTMYWAATPGQTYQIEVSTNLLNWAVVTNITTQSTIGSYTDPTPVQSQRARFFRLVISAVGSNPPLSLRGSISSPAGGFTMNWAANPGNTYEIDVSTNLHNWAFVTSIMTPTTNGSYTDPTPVASQHARFFRLLKQ